MKRLEIIIPDRKLYVVSKVFSDAGITGMSYYSIRGRSKVGVRRGTAGMGAMDYELEFIEKFKVEVVVKDDQVEEIINKLLDRIGGDISTGGKIFVVDVPIAVDLITKRRGEGVI